MRRVKPFQHALGETEDTDTDSDSHISETA